MSPPDSSGLSAGLSSAHRAVLDALADPIVAADESNRIVYANGAAERLLGWAPIELAGKPLTAIMPARFRAAHRAGFERFVRIGRARLLGRPIRVPALHKHGIEIDVELTISRLTGDGAALFVATLRDLRERIELERQVASQRKVMAQYAAVGVLSRAHSIEDAMPAVLEATANALQWNVGVYWALDERDERLRLSAAWSSAPGVADLFVEACRELHFGRGEGLPGQALELGRPLWSKDVRSDDRYVRARLASEHGLRSALLFPVRGSQRTWGVLEYLAAQEEEPDEELAQTMAALGFQIGQFLERVATEGRLREALVEVQAALVREAASAAELERQRDHLHRVFMEAPAPIAIVRGPDFRYELSNPSNQLLAGGRELVGRTVREALPGAEVSRTVALIDEVYRTGRPYVGREYPVHLPGGDGQPPRLAFMNGVIQPLFDRDGRVDGAIMFAYDVTDLVTSRAKAEAAEERLRLAVAAAHVGIYDYYPATGEIRCDARYKALFGASADSEVSAAMLTRAIHPDDQARVRAAVQASFEAPAHGEFDIAYRTLGIEDGVLRSIHVRGRAYFDGTGAPTRFVGIGVDVTAQSRGLERMRFLAEASTVLASSLDHRATVREVARLAVQGLGTFCRIDIVDGEGAIELTTGAYAAAHDAELAPLWRPAAGPPRLVAEVLADGRPVLTDVTSDVLAAMTGDAEQLALLRGMGLRSALLVPLMLRGRPIGVFALFSAEPGRRYDRDDVELGEELARRTAVAVENARLYAEATRAIGIREQFLSIASHELKTPLTSLTLQISALARLFAADRLTTTPKQKLAERLALMEVQGDRLTELMDELLDVSRISAGRLTLERRPTDLVEVVREAIAGVRDGAARQSMTVELGGEAALRGDWDRNRLVQVVTNLLDNAIKYGGPARPISVEVLRAGALARVLVRDQGPGIPESMQRRIFDQFERAASPNLGGLGLGLWIVRKIVEAHGGTIEVESRPNEGATFAVTLPIASANRES